MKQITTLLIFGALLFAGVQSAQAQKVGFTNIELLLAYMPQAEVVDAELKKLEGDLAKGLEVKQKYYQTKLTEYMELEQAGKLTDAEKQTRVQELQKLEIEVQSGVQGAQQKLLQRRMTLLKPIQDKMQKAIDEVAKEGGYEWVINQAAGDGIPSILYGDKSHDLTLKIAGKLGIKVE
ncbi:MAG: OmpH family outer membrane protein [Bacteroidota bacterium]